MAAQKNTLPIEFGSAILVALVVLVVGHLALEHDPTLAPVVGMGALVLLVGLFALFLTKPH